MEAENKHNTQTGDKRMDETQLRKAIKEQGYGLIITLENGKICVANDGFVTDNPADITAVKHSIAYMGFYIQYKRKGNLNGLVDVVRAITRDCRQEGVTA